MLPSSLSNDCSGYYDSLESSLVLYGWY